MNKFSTSFKVGAGYIVLTLILFISLRYIYKEMHVLFEDAGIEKNIIARRQVTNTLIMQLYQSEVIAQSLSNGDAKAFKEYKKSVQESRKSINELKELVNDSVQFGRLDSVDMLLVKKYKNMMTLFSVINQGKEQKIYELYINEAVAKQDSVQPQETTLSKKIVTHTDSFKIPVKRKGFFKRLGEVFSPSKDSTVVSKVVKEELVDTLAMAFNPADTLTAILEDVRAKADDKRQAMEKHINRQLDVVRRGGLELSGKLNNLLESIEDEETLYAAAQYGIKENIRHESILTLSIIAFGSLILAAIFFIVVWRDLLRKKKYRDELEISKRRAEDLLKLRENLMLTITHDLKAPAGSLLGYSELLSQIVGSDRQKFYLNNMQSSAKHLLNLVNSILDFYKLDSDKVTLIEKNYSPNQLFNDICFSFKPAATKNDIDFIFDIEINSSDIFIGDSFRLRQITENLISNAIKFTDKGEVSIKISEENNILHLRISDTGTGISPQDKNKIFKEFTRLSNAQGREGFGLGLAITSKLVKLLKGSITMESVLGKGTSFEVSIPIVKTEKTNVNEGIESNKENSFCMTILLIDDDPIQLQLTSSMLKTIGCKSIGCITQKEIFDALENNNIDIVITDIQMPEINGVDLIHKIHSHEEWKKIPVVAITARQDLNTESLSEHGFSECLHKPFSIKELCDLLQKIGTNLYYDNIEPQSEMCIESKLDFNALVLFSDDDKEATRAILTTFIAETEKNKSHIQLGLMNKDLASIAKIAHKMLPVLTMLKENEIIASLKWLETNNNINTLTPEAEKHILIVLEKIEEVLLEANSYMNKL